MTGVKAPYDAGNMDPARLRRLKEDNRRLLDKERFEKKAVLKSYPPQIQIETTNRCALSCRSCARNYYDRRLNPPADFDPRQYPQFNKLMSNAESVLLGGYGEPLLGRYAAKIMQSAAASGCFIEIITSGAKMYDYWIELFQSLPVGRMIFSVDSANDEGMIRRRGIELKRVLDAVSRVKKACPETKIAFNVTLSRENLEELPDMVTLASDAGVGEVFVAHQKIYTRAQAGLSVLNIFKNAELIFQICREKAEKGRVAIRLPELRGTHECMQPLELMMIRSDGLAMACCSALFGGGAPRIELGRLAESDPLELWNAPQAVNARKRLYGLPHEPGPCDRCGFRIHAPEAMNRFLD